MIQRIKKLYLKFRKDNLDALLISSSSNIRYLTNYEGRDSYLLVSEHKNFFITDFRYLYEAEKKLPNFSIELVNGTFFKLVARLAKKLKVLRIGFEAKNLTFAEAEEIKAELGNKINFIPTYNLVEDLRIIKDYDELSKIRQAIKIAKEAFNLAKEKARPGIKEIDLLEELQGLIFKYRCNPAFDIIVASGPNSSLPHHITSYRKLKKNEVVLVDLGVDFKGYKSDLTRTFFLGKMPLALRRIYKIVLKAQERAIERIRAGVPACDIDSAARQYISLKGYAKYFGHATGHGIGLEVHEAPHLSSKNKDNLKKAMVFTVEPAIYLPDKFGIRIEDMVLVKEKGCEVLSSDIDKSI